MRYLRRLADDWEYCLRSGYSLDELRPIANRMAEALRYISDKAEENGESFDIRRVVDIMEKAA